MKQKYLFSIILSVFLILFFTTSLALIPGDFGGINNGPSDGVVDFEDLMIFAMVYGSTSSDSNWNPVCDIAGPDGKLTPDGVIDFEDLMVFAMHYGECDEDTSLSPITLSDSITFDGKTVIDGGKHTITVKFTAPVTSVRVFIANYSVKEDNIRNLGVIPSNAVEVAMTTADGKTYIGTADFGWGNCNEEWIYVLSGESCCPVVCSRTIIVDSEPPYVELIAEAEPCGDACDPGNRVIITSDGFDPLGEDDCDPLCCGDDCTALGEWTLTVYDIQPFKKDECGDCEAVNACIEPIKVCSSSGCDIECDVFGCVPDAAWADIVGTYYAILDKADLLDNAETTYGILEVGGTSAAPTATLNDATLEDCTLRLVNQDDIMGDCD